ncbi:MAG TPA: TolC family protein [Candidatus Coprenecus stercoravium]|uniref:TolC family protein n=1 Tax=Candidatus Coprenecus stercoravium TaxID=2840735 RepID=A0A9D2KAX2_9BACT|nr:TolC family protein [Candidatus Coprenecus stercoravium]
MRHIAHIITTAAILSAAASVTLSAQPQTRYLTLGECRAIALDSSAVLRGARLMEEKTALDRKAVITNFLPKFSAYGLYLWTSSTFDYDFSGGALPIYKNIYGNLVPDLMKDASGNIVYNGGIPVFNQYAVIPPMTLSIDLANTVTAGVSVTQPVFMGGKIISGYRMADIGTDMAALNSEMKASEVIVSVDEAYWLHVKTCRLLEAAESFSSTVDSMYVFVQNAVDAGMATSTDLLKVEVQKNNAALSLAKARNGKRLSMVNLCHVLGLPLTTRIEVDQSGFNVDSTMFLTPEEIWSGEDTIENRADYRLLVQQAELKRRNVDFVRSDFLPQLGVMASYGYSYGLKLQDEVLLNQAGFTVMATLKVPIFAWGEGWLKVQSAKKEHEMALNEIERLEGLMELEMEQSRYAVSEAALQAGMAASALKSAETNLKVCRDQYELGMETLVNVLEAQTQWSKCASDWIEAVADYRLACTKYLKAIGHLE